MEVTEIILLKRFCQLSSRSRGFFARVWIFKSIGPSPWISLAHKTPSYDTIIVPKVFFDKNMCVTVKFEISNYLKQNNDETDSEQPKIPRKIHTRLWILKTSRKKFANQKSRDFCPNLFDPIKKIHRLGYGFLFFVISISGDAPERVR